MTNLPMKNLYITLLLGCLISHCCAQWKLVWSDEFNGPTIDRSKWGFEIHCSGNGNNELQCYTERRENARIEDGSLVIEARREPGYNGGNGGPKDYTSARLTGFRKVDWTFGKFEARARLPKGKHLWPAFWMMPTDSVYGLVQKYFLLWLMITIGGWAASGEIDIMEYRGQRPNEIMGTLHYSSEWPNNRWSSSGERVMPFDFSDTYHVFGLEWERDQMRWYVDGQKYFEQNLDRFWWEGAGRNPYTANRQPWDQPFYFILNMAVGGNFFGGMGDLSPDDVANTWTQTKFMVDYVRVYRHCQECITPEPLKSPSIPIVAQADATVRSGRYSSRNYGMEKTIQVERAGINHRESFLRFDLSSLSASNVTSAILNLTIHEVNGDRDISMAIVTCWWGEDDIKFTNTPNSIDSKTFTVSSSMTSISIDVLDDVIKALSRDGRLGIRLYSKTRSSLISFYSSEDPVNAPTIFIN
jgi:beta-glucanase (GH16 family)